MTRRELRGWLIVAVFVVTLIDVWGGSLGAVGAFLPPLSRQFHWDHTRLASMGSFISIGIGTGSLIVGWILNRTGARIPMVIGATLTALALLVASRSSSYDAFVFVYLLAGLGLGLCSSVPAAAVIGNWFKRNRGLAMGLTMLGASLGGMICVEVVAKVTAAYGWRSAYVSLAIPIFVIIIPLIILFVRLRPPESTATPAVANPARKAQMELPGLTFRESLHTRSLWCLAFLAVFWTFAILPIVFLLEVYLIGIGYSRESAALALSLVFGFTAAGKPIFGILADWIGARAAQCVAFAMVAVGCMLLAYSSHEIALWLFLPIFGLSWGSPLALYPLVTMDSLGLRDYGAIYGTLSPVHVVGSAIGPLAVGVLADITKSYALGFELCAVSAVIAFALTLACRPEFHAVGEEPRAVPALSEA